MKKYIVKQHWPSYCDFGEKKKETIYKIDDYKNVDFIKRGAKMFDAERMELECCVGGGHHVVVVYTKDKKHYVIAHVIEETENEKHRQINS